MAHGGGCGCKLAPAVLSRILAKMPMAAPAAQLLVGTETDDDAAVYQINEHQAIVATTDFFMPVVDDPFDFGRIAADQCIVGRLRHGRNAHHGARGGGHAGG